MKLGISSYTYTWNIGFEGCIPLKPFDENSLIAIAEQNGISVLQIADNLPLHSFSNERLSLLLQYAKQAGIDLEVGAKDLTDSNLEKYLSIAEKLDSRILRFVIDGTDNKPSLDKVVRIIKNVITELRNRNIILALENHDRFKAREFESIIQKCGSENIGICLDSVNSLGAGEDVYRITEILAPFTVNLHVKEFVISRLSHKMGFTVVGCPVGEGMLPLEWLLRKLNPAICKTAILEQWTPPEESLEKTVVKEQDWALKSINYLKNIFNNQ